jgi:predicted metal-binding protein
VALLICRTCPRYQDDVGSFGPRLDQALVAACGGTGLRIRHVQCVGGCPDPGNVALDSLGKARVRISRIDALDAGALLEAVTAYESSATGIPAEWQVPDSLVSRISAVSPKAVSNPRSGE